MARKTTKLREMLEDEYVRTNAIGAAVMVLEKRNGICPPGMYDAINAAIDEALRDAERRLKRGDKPSPVVRDNWPSV